MGISLLFRRAIFLFLCLSFYSTFMLAQDNDFCTQGWKFIPDLDNIGGANFIEFDVDNDNRPELLYSSRQSSSISNLSILDYNDSGQYAVSLSTLKDDVIEWMQVYDYDNNGTSELLLLFGDQIEIVDPSTLGVLDTIELNDNNAVKFFIDDVDGNEGNEIILQTSNAVKILSLEGDELQSMNISNIRDIAYGNVDNDEEKEIIVAATDGFILSNQNLSVEWSFLGGFGYTLALADIDNSGKALIYAADNYDFVTCFDGQLHSPLWQIDVDDQITHIEVHDIDGDGVFELLLGKDWDFDGMHCFNVETQELLWEREILNDGITNFGVADFDSDGTIEIAYGCGHTTSSEDLLVVFEPLVPDNEHESFDLEGPFQIDVTDVGSDDYPNLFYASKSSNSGYDGGVGFMLDGLSKAILRDGLMPSAWDDIVDVSSIKSENGSYLMFLYNDRLIIYNYENETIAIDENLSDYTAMGKFYIDENEMGAPQLFLFQNNGLVKVYDFEDGILSNSWNTLATGATVYDYQFGNFDTDQATELAILSSNIVSIYDLETHLLQSQTPVGNGARAFAIADIDGNGVQNLLYLASSNTMRVINIDDNTYTSYPVNISVLKKIEVENLDQDTNYEIVLLSDRLSIYNSDFSELKFESGVINSGTSFSNTRNDLNVIDFDEDQKMEIFVGTDYGVYEYQVTENYLDINPPYVRHFLPAENATLLPLDAVLEVTFSEEMNGNSFENQIEIIDDQANDLNFSYTYQAGERKLSISPDPLWPANEILNVTLKYPIADTTGNTLDGNKNGISEENEDNFTWSFEFGADIDLVGPTIVDLDGPVSIFRGAPISYTGFASDSSIVAMTHVVYIEYFLDEEVIQGMGTALPALDGTYDEAREDFIIPINTSELAYGDHTLSVVAQDASGNFGITEVLNFNIIEEDPANWTQYHNNNLNTGANPYSEFKAPFSIQYQIVDDEPIGRSIVVEDFLIYTISGNFGGTAALVCRNINTGELLWDQSFALSDGLYPPAYAYGMVYVQLGDHSDSKLAAYDLITGEEVWTTDYSTQWMDAYGPMVYEGKVYINEGYYSSTVGAYDAFTGEFLWINDIHSNDNYDEWLPAIYQDTMYGYAENLGALNPTNGALHYSITEDDIPFNWPGWTMNASTVVDSANNQLILTSRSFTHAFSLDTKEVLWSLTSSMQGLFRATPALYDGELFVATNERASVINTLTGEQEWDYPAESSDGFTYQPVVNEHIFAFSNGTKTYVFDRESRALIATVPAGGELTLSKDYLIVASNSGLLNVFKFDENASVLSGSLEVTQALVCHGDSNGEITANVSGGGGFYEFDWSVFVFGNPSTLTNLEADTYSVTVTDNFFNSITLDVELSQPNELIVSEELSPETGTNMNGEILLNVEGGVPPYDFEWEDFPANNSNQLGNLGSGDYEVEIIDAVGCNVIQNYTVEMINNADDKPNLESVNLYPSLTTGLFWIESEASLHNVRVDMFRLDGTLISVQQFEQLSRQEFSLANEASGSYFVILYADEGVYSSRIILTK